MGVIVSGAMRVSMRMSSIMGMPVVMVVVVSVSVVIRVVMSVVMRMIMVAMGQRIQLGMQGMIEQIQAQRIQQKQRALRESDRTRGSFDAVSGNAFP